MKTLLLVIDPQNDFCQPTGSLYVDGALNDMNRLAAFVYQFGHNLTSIMCTLDSHHLHSVFHPGFWTNGTGQSPAPFTVITSKDIKNATWLPTLKDNYDNALKYTEELEKAGKYSLTIWPVHTLIGSYGHNVFPRLHDSFLTWEGWGGSVRYVTKGENTKVENYSAFSAEVEDPNDEKTKLNKKLMLEIEEYDSILIAGEALNFCVKSTVMDLVGNIDPKNASKITMLTDAMSPVKVPNYDNQCKAFFDTLAGLGVKFSTADKFFE